MARGQRRGVRAEGYQVPFEVLDLSYAEALQTLRAACKFGIQPMLETVVDMLAELGDPDLCFRSLQIAGTNGKTSTSRYAAAILRGQGLRVALYTSPELVSLTERMEVDGVPVSEGTFAHGVAAAAEAGRRVNIRRRASGERPYDVTQFDILTVAACVAFAQADVDVAVLECGMGGRWDATSAVKSIEAVAVTGVGLDHTRILGDTLEAIAGEKAAIIRCGQSCVLGVGTATPDSVEDVFLDRCRSQDVTPVLLRPECLEDAAGEMHAGVPRRHASLLRASYRITSRPRRLGAPLELTVRTPRRAYTGLTALKPSYQAANIACAVTLTEAFLDGELDGDRLLESVRQCPTPGRLSQRSPNPHVRVDACQQPAVCGCLSRRPAGHCPRSSHAPTPALCRPCRQGRGRHRVAPRSCISRRRLHADVLVALPGCRRTCPTLLGGRGKSHRKLRERRCRTCCHERGASRRLWVYHACWCACCTSCVVLLELPERCQ